MSIPIAVIEIPDEEERKLRAKTPEILEITELEEKPIKKSVSCIKFIEKQQPEPQDAEPKYKSFAYDNGESTCINLYQVFNIILLVLKQEINGQQNYENHEKRK